MRFVFVTNLMGVSTRVQYLKYCALLEHPLPPAIDSNPKMMLVVKEASEKSMLLITPKRATEAASSMLATAMMRVGMPLATP